MNNGLTRLPQIQPAVSGASTFFLIGHRLYLVATAFVFLGSLRTMGVAAEITQSDLTKVISTTNDSVARSKEYCAHRRFSIRSFTAGQRTLKSVTHLDIAAMIDRLEADTSDEGLQLFCEDTLIVKQRNPWMTADVTILPDGFAESYSSAITGLDGTEAGKRSVKRVITRAGAVQFKQKPGLSQASITDSDLPQFQLQDLFLFPKFSADRAIVSTAIQIGDQVTFDIASKQFTSRWTINTTVSLPAKLIIISGAEEVLSIRFQRLFRRYDDGALLPSLTAECRFRHGLLDFMRLFVIDSTSAVDIAATTPTVEIPANSTIVDYRDSPSNPRLLTTHAAVKDVISYTNDVRSGASQEASQRRETPDDRSWLSPRIVLVSCNLVVWGAAVIWIYKRRRSA